MRSILQKLWRSTGGFVISSELVLVAGLTTIGLVSGLIQVRNEVVSALSNVGAVFANLNQSYSTRGIRAYCASTNGSNFIDSGDFCGPGWGESSSQPTINVNVCVLVCNSLQEEQ